MNGRWQEQAACRGMDPDLFFPDLTTLGPKPPLTKLRDACAHALAVCATCPVAEQCREAGREAPGVWGGTVERERNPRAVRSAERHRQRQAARAAGLADSDPRHGTATGYDNFGCRCEPCRQIGAAVQRARRAARQQVMA